jgi:hypothetical protein
MQQSIVKFLLLCRTDTAQHVSGITMPIIRSLSNCHLASGFRMNVEMEVFSAVVGLLGVGLYYTVDGMLRLLILDE